MYTDNPVPVLENARGYLAARADRLTCRQRKSYSPTRAKQIEQLHNLYDSIYSMQLEHEIGYKTGPGGT